MWVAVAIGAQTHFIQKLFPFPVLATAILNFGTATSGSVDCVIPESGMAEHMGVEVGIAVPSLAVISTSGLMVVTLDFGSRQRQAVFSVT